MRSWCNPARSSRGMSKAYNSTSYSGMHIGVLLTGENRPFNRSSDKQVRLAARDRGETEIYAQGSNERTGKDGGTGGGEPDNRGRRRRERQRVSARTREGEQIIEGGRGGHLLRSC